jgi:hypothetical protein
LTRCAQLNLPVTVGGVVVIRNLGTALHNFQSMKSKPSREVMMMAKQILEDVPDEERSLFQKLAKEKCPPARSPAPTKRPRPPSATEKRSALDFFEGVDLTAGSIQTDQ